METPFYIYWMQQFKMIFVKCTFHLLLILDIQQTNRLLNIKLISWSDFAIIQMHFVLDFLRSAKGILSTKEPTIS